MKNLKKLLGLSIVILAFSCGKEKVESQSMEQLYAENGVPVKIQEIRKQAFSQSLFYFANLTGIRQSSKHAAIGDRIKKVHFNVGDAVKAGQNVVSFPTDNPEAQYYQTKVAYENAKKSYERLKKLLSEGGVSQQDFDNAETQYKVMEANWESVSKSVHVKAPISGVITTLNVRASENVGREDLLFTVSDLSKMKAKIWVSEKNIASIQKGNKAYATWQGKTIEGEVVEFDRSISPMKQAFGVVLEFDNPGTISFSGITADIKVETYSNPEGIVVERNHLIKEDGRYFVYLANQDQAKITEVKPGEEYENRVEIITGLKSGDQMIVSGLTNLENGSKIKIIK